MYRIDRRRRQEHTSALLRLLFLPAADDEPQPIACLVETPEELSVMCGADSWFGAHCEAHVGDGAQSSSQLWLPIRVGGADGIGLDEVGVIAAMATPLAQASVPVLYVSAFSNDYVLVPAALTDVSVDAFEARTKGPRLEAGVVVERGDHLLVLLAQSRARCVDEPVVTARCAVRYALSRS